MDDELAAILTALAFYTVYLLGLCLAVVVSWSNQQSVFWSSVDGLLSWLYILYHFELAGLLS